MTTAYIALGSNLGQKRRNLEGAAVLISQLPGTRISKSSELHRTKAVGGPAGQPDYLNAVLAVETELGAEELLQALLEIEGVLGRTRTGEVRNGPRIIDLDLLLYGEEILERPGLTVPHPRMHDRRFVLGPLVEIAPEVVHPVLRVTIRELLARLPK